MKGRIRFCLFPVSFVFLEVMLGQAVAFVYVKSFHNDTLNKFADLPAAFGPSFPFDGLWGHIEYTEPPDACSVIKKHRNGSDWIAVISMSDKCRFYEQVFNAQQAGFIAAIVYNNESDVLYKMRNSSKPLHIPSTFIGANSTRLLQQYDLRRDVNIVIYKPYPYYNDELLLIILAAISSFSAVVVLSIVIGIGIHNCCRNRAQLLSRWKLKRLPLHTFKKGDVYENCAICLEEYSEGDKLRILPCEHAFHSKCIDPWLTKNKKTCPLCNETVNPRRNSNRKSRTRSEHEDERTPLLLPANQDGDVEQQAEPTNVSIMQSSAEVHEEPALRHTSSHRNYGATDMSGVSGASASVLDLEDDCLLATRGVNNLGQSPLCHIEAEPNLARFLPPVEGEVSSLENPVERSGIRKQGRPKQPQQPGVVISGRNPDRGNDRIV